MQWFAFTALALFGSVPTPQAVSDPNLASRLRRSLYSTNKEQRAAGAKLISQLGFGSGEHAQQLPTSFSCARVRGTFSRLIELLEDADADVRLSAAEALITATSDWEGGKLYLINSVLPALARLIGTTAARHPQGCKLLTFLFSVRGAFPFLFLT